MPAHPYGGSMHIIVAWLKKFEPNMIMKFDDFFNSEKGDWEKKLVTVPEFVWGRLERRRSRISHIIDTPLFKSKRYSTYRTDWPELNVVVDVVLKMRYHLRRLKDSHMDHMYKRLRIGEDIYSPYVLCLDEGDDLYRESQKRKVFCDVSHIAFLDNRNYLDVTDDFSNRDIIQYSRGFASSKLCHYKNIRRCSYKSRLFTRPGRNLPDIWYIEDKDDTIDVSSYCPIKSIRHKKINHTAVGKGSAQNRRDWKFLTKNKFQWEHNL